MCVSLCVCVFVCVSLCVSLCVSRAPRPPGNNNNNNNNKHTERSAETPLLPPAGRPVQRAELHSPLPPHGGRRGQHAARRPANHRSSRCKHSGYCICSGSIVAMATRSILMSRVQFPVGIFLNASRIRIIMFLSCR